MVENIIYIIIASFDNVFFTIYKKCEKMFKNGSNWFKKQKIQILIKKRGFFKNRRTNQSRVRSYLPSLAFSTFTTKVLFRFLAQKAMVKTCTKLISSLLSLDTTFGYSLIHII